MLQFEIQLGNIWDPLAKIRGYLSNLYEGCPKIRAVEILNNIWSSNKDMKRLRWSYMSLLLFFVCS